MAQLTRIIEVLERLGEATLIQISEETGISRANLSRAIATSDDITLKRMDGRRKVFGLRDREHWKKTQREHWKKTQCVIQDRIRYNLMTSTWVCSIPAAVLEKTPATLGGDQIGGLVQQRSAQSVRYAALHWPQARGEKVDVDLYTTDKGSWFFSYMGGEQPWICPLLTPSDALYVLEGLHMYKEIETFLSELVYDA